MRGLDIATETVACLERRALMPRNFSAPLKSHVIFSSLGTTQQIFELDGPGLIGERDVDNCISTLVDHPFDVVDLQVCGLRDDTIVGVSN